METEERLDLLINGDSMKHYVTENTITPEGNEITFAYNYLGHFYLTYLLLDTIKASAPSRIITVTSALLTRGVINRANLQGDTAIQAYFNSMLANFLFARQLAILLEGTGVTSNSVNLGGVEAERVTRDSNLYHSLLAPFSWFFFKSKWAGAQTMLAVALDPDYENVTGQFFENDAVVDENKLKDVPDREVSEWLWQESERLVGLTW